MNKASRQTSFVKVLYLTLAIGLLGFTGCGGPDYVPVYGTVEFKDDGSKAQFGSIEFRSDTDPPIIARGKINKDGSFRVDVADKDGTIEGTHSVVIIQVVGNIRTGKVIHNHGLEVAKKYSDHRTTDLVVKLDRETAANMKLVVDSKAIDPKLDKGGLR